MPAFGAGHEGWEESFRQVVLGEGVDAEGAVEAVSAKSSSKCHG